MREVIEEALRPIAPDRPAWSYEAEARDIRVRYSLAIIEARRSGKPRHEIAAIIRALREQQAQELRAVRERRKREAVSRLPVRREDRSA